MSACVRCGLELAGTTAICPYHFAEVGPDWAVSNRLLCNGLHRHQWPPRLPEAERDDTPIPADCF